VENKKNLLVTLADKKFLPQAKQLFSSVYWNAGWDGDYMLLGAEIPEEELWWFYDKKILVKKCKTLYDKNIGADKFPPLVLDLFYLFTPEFRKWKNIVFLDADIIVRASLESLTKVKGFASPNILGDKLFLFFCKDADIQQYKMLEANYDLNVTPFNSGVIAFSTDIIKDDTFDQLMNLFYTYENINSGNDPILNLLFYKKWKKLPIVYDITPKTISKYTGLNADKLQGIIMHLKDDELSDEKYAFYKEWKLNLEKAENIDLKKTPKAKKWSAFRITYYSGVIKTRYFLYLFKISTFPKIRIKLKSGILYIIYLPDRCAGKAGSLLKKHYPALYKKLKKN